MNIVGISAYYHDSAACLVVDGRVIAAAQEERFSRRKHDAGFPEAALRYCLEAGGLEARSVDHVVFYDKPFLKFERLLETYLACAPAGFRSFSKAMPTWLKEKLFQKSTLVHELRRVLGPGVDWHARLRFSEHHLSHAASAFYASPFEEALVLTMDGVGEWTTTSVTVGRGAQLSPIKEIHFPHSLGLLYSAFTQYCGFKVNSGEYKLMGLAPYGEPRHAALIREHLVDIKDDGSFRLDMRYFDYAVGLTMTNHRFHDLFGGPPRPPESALGQREMDLAASIQAVTEEVVLKLGAATANETGLRRLCLAGGVALNCVANGRLLREGPFDEIWVPPAAGDAGGAVGAALAFHHMGTGAPRTRPDGDPMQGAYLGPAYQQEDIERRLVQAGATFEVMSEDELVARSARVLADGKALGWHQGRMEFGPRSLGARSILGDPRAPQMQKILNLKVKQRESFRPFAPSVLREDVAEWFDLDEDSPYMNLVAPVALAKRTPLTPEDSRRSGVDKVNAARSLIPAVTHVDYSARIQTVDRDRNPLYHALISRFKGLTGCGVVVNTSFNVRGEPIVCTPEDAFRCFMSTGIDALAVGRCWMDKAAQAPTAAVPAPVYEPD